MCGKWTPEREAWCRALFSYANRIRQERECSHVDALDAAGDSLQRGGKIV